MFEVESMESDLDCRNDSYARDGDGALIRGVMELETLEPDILCIQAMVGSEDGGSVVRS